MNLTTEENQTKITSTELDIVELEYQLETKKRELKLYTNLKPLLYDIERSNRNSIERKKERNSLINKRKIERKKLINQYNNDVVKVKVDLTK